MDLATITILLKLADTIASKLPDTDQKLLIKYLETKREFLYENSIAYPERDDNLVDTLRDELFIAIEGTLKKVSEKNL